MNLFEKILETMNSTSFAIGVTVFSALVVLVAAIAQRNSLRSIELRMQRAELTEIRKHLESQVYNTNRKLTQNAARFRDVNHLILDADASSNDIRSSDLTESIPNSFLKSFGINESGLTVEAGKVFVLSPFHPEFSKTYDTISKVGSELGLNVTRGDEVIQSSNILKFIIEEILKSEFIIANVDGRNPNVFYELGIAQALGKVVFIITSEVKNIEFDLSTQKLILWETEEDLKTSLFSTIAKYSLAKSVSGEK